MEPLFNAYCVHYSVYAGDVIYKGMSAFFLFWNLCECVATQLCVWRLMLQALFYIVYVIHIFSVDLEMPCLFIAICFLCKTIIMNCNLQWEWGEVSLVVMVGMGWLVGMGVGRRREVLQSGDLTKSVDKLWKLPAAYSVQTAVRKHKSQKTFKCMHTTTTLWMWINPKSVNFWGDHKYFTAVHATFSLLNLLAFLVGWLILVCHKYLSAVHCHYF